MVSISEEDARGAEQVGADQVYHEIDEADEQGWETASQGDGDEKSESEESSDEDPLRCHSSSIGAADVEEKLGGLELTEESRVEDERNRKHVLSIAEAVKVEGNSRYAEGKFLEALSCYARALETGLDQYPEDLDSKELRAICHSNRSICYIQLSNYEAAVKESTKSLELKPGYMKTLLRRAEAHEKLQNFEEAIVDLKEIEKLDPGKTHAKNTIQRLEPLAEQKREKLKQEMLEKLKETGNSILGMFGMSLDNFKSVKDPNTGSYSFEFRR